MRITVALKWFLPTTVLLLLTASTVAKDSGVLSIAGQDAYYLAPPFTSNITQGFVDGTTTSSATLSSAFADAQKIEFISYDPEFDAIVGRSPHAQRVANITNGDAAEAGIWIPKLNQIWFSGTLAVGPTSIHILNLSDNSVITPPLKAAPGYENVLPLANPAGGYYFNGQYYLCLTGNERDPAGLVAIDPVTYMVTPVLNSYLGLEFPPLDDVSVAYTNTSNGTQTHIYFSTIDLSIFGLKLGRPPAQLPNAFWKFTLETQTLQPVIPRADVFSPNGVQVDPTLQYLYVTDSTATASVGGGVMWNLTSSPAIYRYDIGKDGYPHNKVLVGFSRQGIPDGIRIDDYGRIWTAEGEGIVVRSPAGKVLGLFNKDVILGTTSPPVAIANFGIAGNKLYIMAVDHIQVVTLAQNLTTAARYEVPE